MRSLRGSALLLAALAASAPALAQETVPAGSTATSAVRVVKDRATVWTRNPSMVLAVIPAGTVLQALSRDDKWYEVVVPEKLGGRGGKAIGFIFAGYVERVAGTPEPPTRPSRPADSSWDPVSAGGQVGAPRRPPVKRPAFGARGYGAFDYMFFQAQDSFDAILASSSQPFYGFGGEVVFAEHFFVGASWSRFKKTGQRVFVADGEVFPLGIDDTMTITPINVTGGYRFSSMDRFVPYLGGGAGVYQFEETSEFADPAENVDERYTSYHGLAGVEYTVSKWVFTAFEVQYTSVPDSLGAPGVSAEFDEKNLGGLSLRIKVLIGR